MDRAVGTYRQAIERMFSFTKAATRLDELFGRLLPLADEQGWLMPVSTLHSGDAALISKLSGWRRANVAAYPTVFPVSDEGTGAWLRDRLLAVPDRILFLVLDRFGRPVGHLGYASCLNDDMAMEIDNVVRGEQDAPRGIMSRAMTAVLDWARELFGPEEIFLRVFEDNEHAILFYERLGFVRDERIGLRKHGDGDTYSFQPLSAGDTAPPDRVFQRMVHRPAAPSVGETMILTAGPSISAKEVCYAADAARNGWNNQWSRYLSAFESSFADYIGVKHAIATSSCTGAMHIALLALGIGPGDEVIVPDITWVATANAVMYCGATPVFADVEPDSWCISPASVEAHITDRTRAIIPVHLYGHPARMDRILELAKAHELRVIEDAAPSIGAEWQGRRTGSFGDFGCFSFQGAKLLVTGEGGILLTDDQALYERALKIWDQGRQPGTFWIDELGWKYKMANVQAAIGLGQLERIDELVAAKRRIFQWYERHLEGVPHISLWREVEGARSIYWMTNILVGAEAPIGRDELRNQLRARNIDSRPVFPPISRYRFWPRPQDSGEVASRIGDGGINLPSGVRLKEAQVAYICRSIREIMEGSR